jgi:ABC-type lipoprotein export system ATPase subunit
MSPELNVSAAAVALSAKAKGTSGVEHQQQRLLSLEVVRLKGLREVALDFSTSPLTAIMGSNCSGKTTVLHALACAYKPPTGSAYGYKFPMFFRPNTDALWTDSDFSISYSYRVGKLDFPNQLQRYSKASDRWSPRYEQRPERFTRFVNIGESVPDIETINLNSMIRYVRSETTDQISDIVREIAGQVLNRKYETLYDVQYAYRDKRSIGVKSRDINYSGLSMSSGEQRVFRILEAVFRAKPYSLILVDEIDIFLHQDALKRLLDKLNIHCKATNKQLVFTTHFPAVAEMYNDIQIYTLNQNPVKTEVWQGYSYDGLRLITGQSQKPITCFVEDEVAERIVGHVAGELGVRRHLNIRRYGPAINAFVVGAGLLFHSSHNDHALVILDGDVFSSGKDRLERTKALVTGNSPPDKKRRHALMKLIRPLAAMRGAKGDRLAPEQILHHMVRNVNVTIPESLKEVYEIARSIENVPERHGFVTQIIDHTGEVHAVALSKIIELASYSSEWPRYTRLVRVWLQSQKLSLNL